jgi:cytochrome c-type biogenesis protein CcmH/NrfG
MGQCYVRLKKPRAALRAFRSAYRINPNLDDVKEAISSLEEVLGEE